MAINAHGFAFKAGERHVFVMQRGNAVLFDVVMLPVKLGNLVCIRARMQFC